MDNFITPPNHINFKAKKLFGAMGTIIDGSIAYVDLNGGGPTEQHTHEHNHLFIVTQGEAKIKLADSEVVVKKDEAFLVEGNIPHSVWNNLESETIMIGISLLFAVTSLQIVNPSISGSIKSKRIKSGR